jgi:hypothetical protein
LRKTFGLPGPKTHRATITAGKETFRIRQPGTVPLPEAILRSLPRLLLAILIGGPANPARADGPLLNWNDAADRATGPDLDEPLATDRPDFTEASSTVGRGVLQLESGYTYFLNDDAGLREELHSCGEFLFRYGVIDDWFELRLVVLPLHERIDDGVVPASESGVSDLVVGCKTWLTAQDGWRPEVAVITALTLPTGSDPFTANDVQPGVNWLYGWDLSDRWSTAGSTGFYRTADDLDHDHLLVTQSWTFGYAFTESLGGYAETFALLPHSGLAAKPEYYVDGGLTYKFTKDIQADVRAGYGLNAAASDLFAGVGLSIRWP